MREFADGEPSDANEWEEAARALVRGGKVAVIALTMGHLGAALVTPNQVWRAQPLPIKPVSAVGAEHFYWRAHLATGVGGRSRKNLSGRPSLPALPALLNPGTELCRPDDIKRLAELVILTAA